MSCATAKIHPEHLWLPQLNVLQEDNVSKGTFKVDLQHSSKGKQDGLKWGTNSSPSQSTAQALVFPPGSMEGEGPRLSRLSQPRRVCRTAVRGTLLCRGAGSWASTDRLTAPACPRVRDKRLLGGSGQAL